MTIKEILIPLVLFVAIGILATIILFLADQFMAVKSDETTEKVRDALPGANCGACGFAGCDEYAKAVAAGTAKANLCVPGGKATAEKISAALGIAVEGVEEKRAFVRCNGSCDVAEDIMDYEGVQSCAACNMMYQGKKKCNFGCLGYGDCLKVCKFDAIELVNGIAVINQQNCTGCGACAKECPNGLIDVLPESAFTFVACSNTTKGNQTRAVCKNGCIGCMKCTKVCPNDAIHVENNLAQIDYDKCINCGECVRNCPVGAIVQR